MSCRLALVIGCVVLGACNALTGVGDLATGSGDAGEQDAADAGIASDGGMDDARNVEASATDTGPAVDGGSDGGAPSYCTGVLFYARFDGTLTSAEGQPGVGPDGGPTITFAPGRFGQAGYSAATTSSVYYATDGGAAPYELARGSVALWIKATWAWPPTTTRRFFKPLTDESSTGALSGPEIAAGTGFGAFVAGDANDAGAISGFDTFTAGWKDLDWNHVAATWTASPAAATFALNGGDPSYFESDAGWVVQPTIGFIRFGSNQYPVDAYLDDAVIWDRVLSLAEINAIYTSGVALGDACGL